MFQVGQKVEAKFWKSAMNPEHPWYVGTITEIKEKTDENGTYYVYRVELENGEGWRTAFEVREIQEESEVPSAKTVGKALSDAQAAALDAAIKKANVTASAAVEKGLSMFCEAQGVEFPASKPHGGPRELWWKRPMHLHSKKHGVDVERVLAWVNHRDLNTKESSWEAQETIRIDDQQLYVWVARDEDGFRVIDADLDGQPISLKIESK